MEIHELEITESGVSYVELTHEQAAALRHLGRRLIAASSVTDADAPARTAVECSTSDGKTWRIQVSNAIGVIGVPGLRIVVRPKIPEMHLIYLLTIGGILPRTTPSAVDFHQTKNFWVLLATWYIKSLEHLLNGGLASSYVTRQDRQPFMRGRINLRTAATDLLQGKTGFECSYEEFTTDTALNRILSAAAHRIARNSSLPRNLRQRALRSLTHLEEAGEFADVDLLAIPDRTTVRYGMAVAYARLVLAGSAPGLQRGAHSGETFLIPTPIYVESALRHLASEALSGITDVQKGRRKLGGTEMSINPDLVLGDRAVGDIKYKVWDGTWSRPDLYQLAAFSVGYRRQTALHVGFSSDDVSGPIDVGDVRIWRVRWDTRQDLLAEESAEQFISDIQSWWRDSDGSTTPDKIQSV